LEESQKPHAAGEQLAGQPRTSGLRPLWSHNPTMMVRQIAHDDVERLRNMTTSVSPAPPQRAAETSAGQIGLDEAGDEQAMARGR